AGSCCSVHAPPTSLSALRRMVAEKRAGKEPYVWVSTANPRALADAYPGARPANLDLAAQQFWEFHINEEKETKLADWALRVNGSLTVAQLLNLIVDVGAAARKYGALSFLGGGAIMRKHLVCHRDLFARAENFGNLPRHVLLPEAAQAWETAKEAEKT